MIKYTLRIEIKLDVRFSRLKSVLALEKLIHVADFQEVRGGGGASDSEHVGRQRDWLTLSWMISIKLATRQ